MPLPSGSCLVATLPAFCTWTPLACLGSPDLLRLSEPDFTVYVLAASYQWLEAGFWNNTEAQSWAWSSASWHREQDDPRPDLALSTVEAKTLAVCSFHCYDRSRAACCGTPSPAQHRLLWCMHALLNNVHANHHTKFMVNIMAFSCMFHSP